MLQKIIYITTEVRYLTLRFIRKAIRNDATNILKDCSKNRKIFIDISVIHSNDFHSGIQRVVKEILRHLIVLTPKDSIICPIVATKYTKYKYVSYDKIFFIADLAMPRSYQLLCQTNIKPNQGDIFFELDLAASILPRHWMQLYGFRRKKVKMVALVHDLLPINHPDWFTRKGVKNFRRWIETVAIFFDHLICVSDSTAKEAQYWLGETFKINSFESPKITSIFLGSKFSPTLSYDNTIIDEYSFLSISKYNYSFLMVGTIEPRKCHKKVIEAFDLLWKKNISICLIIVGKIGWQVKNLLDFLRNHPEINNRLIWVKNADDRTLFYLYQNTDGLISASLGEGFGLPLVEAANMGKPILCRNLPVFKDILGEEATYFENDDPVNFSDSILKWTKAIANRSVPNCKKGQQLTWAETTQILGEQLLD